MNTKESMNAKRFIEDINAAACHAAGSPLSGADKASIFDALQKLTNARKWQFGQKDWEAAMDAALIKDGAWVAEGHIHFGREIDTRE